MSHADLTKSTGYLQLKALGSGVTGNSRCMHGTLLHKFAQHQTLETRHAQISDLAFSKSMCGAKYSVYVLHMDICRPDTRNDKIITIEPAKILLDSLFMYN